MRKKLLHIFSLIVLCNTAFTQNKLTDSLKRVLVITKEDTSRVEVLAELGLQYRNSNPDSSIFYGEKSLELAREIKFRRGEALALCNIGLAFREKGDLPKALELEMQALQIAEPNNYVVETALCFRRIGLVYMDLRDYPSALDYLQKALQKHELIAYKRGIGIEHMNLGMTYEYMGNLDSALPHIQKAEENKNYIEELYPEVNRVFGNIYAKKGDRQLAMFYYNKGIQAGLRLNDFRTISFIHADVAKMYRQLNLPDSSILYAKQGVTYGQKASYQKGILFSSTILSELYDSINPKEALHYYKIAATAKENLFGAGNIQTIQALIAKEQARQKEIESEKIAYQNRLKQYGLLAGLAFFCVIAFILYRNNRQKQKTNKVLGETLENLKSTQSQLIQSEKMASLGELTAGIAHEIQNPLNFVNNFSEVNKELVDELQQELKAGKINDAIAISSDIKDNEQKINHHGKRADAIVKGMLQHSRSSSGQKEPTDINALADEYLRLAYHGLRAKDKTFNAAMQTDYDENIGAIHIVPQDIGRVILNLITNAFYAVAEKSAEARAAGDNDYKPTVSVSTKKRSGWVEIKVSDNGKGIPPAIIARIFQPFFTTKPTGKGTGLGLSMSYDIVTMGHGGELKTESKEGEGATFIITLPNS